MSLPNSPADPYPESFGWPWHGLVRRPARNQITDPPMGCEIVLPSGATRPMPSGNLVGGGVFTHSHPFVVPGLPAPDIPTEADQAYLSRGIRRSDGQWFWDHIGPPALVCSGAPWRVDDVLVFTSDVKRLEVAVYVESVDGEAVTLRYSSPSENSFDLPSGVIPYDISFTQMMAGGAGDRWLYLVEMNLGAGRERVCIFEVIADMDSRDVNVVYHAKYSDLYTVVSVTPTSESSPTWVIYYYAGQDPVVKQYGDPPDNPNWYTSVTYSVGSYSYSTEAQWTIWAWYKQDAVTVELVRLNVRLEFEKSFGGGLGVRFFENTNSRTMFSLQGHELFTHVWEVESNFGALGGVADGSERFYAQGAQLYSGDLPDTGPRQPIVHLEQYIPDPTPRWIDYAGEFPPTAGPSGISMTIYVQKLSNALLAMGYRAETPATRFFQSGAISPSGAHPGDHVIADSGALTPDQRACWTSGAWNPITGEVRRADTNYRYNWV